MSGIPHRPSQPRHLATGRADPALRAFPVSADPFSIARGRRASSAH